jgi:hypothetical protein
MRSIAGPLALLASLGTVGAAAQTSSAVAVGSDASLTLNEEAVRLAHQGKAQFESGHPRQALASFQQAKALANSPTIELYIARAHKALGEWTSAQAAYDTCLQAPQDESNAAWVATREAALEERRTLEAQMPRLTLRAVDLPSGATPRVTLDGGLLPWPVVDAPMNPGRHSLVAKLGDSVQSFDVIATPGERSALEWRVQGAERDVNTRAGAPAASAAVATEAPQQKSLTPWLWTAGATTVVALGVGIGTGVTAWVQADQVKEWCRVPGNDCSNNVPADEGVRAQQDFSRTMGDVSTVSFAVAGVALAASITLFAVHLSQPRKPEVALYAKGTFLGLRGAF